jgi:glucosamine kinase
MSARVAFAGADAGGSHTEVVLGDADLRELSRARGPAGAVRPGKESAAAAAIAATVHEAVEQAGPTWHVRALVVGAAGAGRGPEREALGAALRGLLPGTDIHVTTDAEVALASVFPDSAGLLLLAGSGSIAYARDEGGGVHRVGGHGWQMGDEGSGYALGRAALAAVARAADRRGTATALDAELREATGCADLDHLVRWAQGASRQDVAGLAEIVQRVARRGDAVAVGVVQDAARELALHVRAILERLPGTREHALVLGGGLLTTTTPLREALVTRLREDAPRARVMDRVVDAARGALVLAARRSGARGATT